MKNVISLYNKPNGFYSKDFSSFYDIEQNRKTKGYDLGVHIHEGKIGFWKRQIFHSFTQDIQESYQEWLKYKEGN